jgi:hypothetical protein
MLVEDYACPEKRVHPLEYGMDRILINPMEPNRKTNEGPREGESNRE